MTNRTLSAISTAASRSFITAYVTTMRPYLLFVSGITGIAGMSFLPEIPVSQFVLVFIASFLSYGFGQALTDCFQIDTDSLSAPYRPLTQGIISRTDVLRMSAAGLLVCIFIFALYNYMNLVVGLMCGIGLYTYTTFKKKWWAGPFYNAFIVVALFWMAFLSGYHVSITGISLPLICTMLVVFFGYANFVLAGYFKDIRADRATAYNTLPVVYGMKVAARVSDVFAFLTFLFLVTVVARDWEHATGSMARSLSVVFALSGAVILILAQRRLHRVTRDEEAHGAISFVVHSYILLLSGIACLQKPEWALFLMLFYGTFIVVFNLRPVRQQI